MKLWEPIPRAKVPEEVKEAQHPQNQKISIANEVKEALDAWMHAIGEGSFIPLNVSTSASEIQKEDHSAQFIYAKKEEEKRKTKLLSRFFPFELFILKVSFVYAISAMRKKIVSFH